MSSEINLSGEIFITGTRFFVTPVGYLNKVLSMRFNNSVPYTLELTKYNASTGNTITIYRLSLDGGDTMTDNFCYSLNANEYLTVTCNVPGTSYIIFGTSIPVT